MTTIIKFLSFVAAPGRLLVSCVLNTLELFFELLVDAKVEGLSAFDDLSLIALFDGHGTDMEHVQYRCRTLS